MKRMIAGALFATLAALSGCTSSTPPAPAPSSPLALIRLGEPDCNPDKPNGVNVSYAPQSDSTTHTCGDPAKHTDVVYSTGHDLAVPAWVEWCKANIEPGGSGLRACGYEYRDKTGTSRFIVYGRPGDGLDFATELHLKTGGSVVALLCGRIGDSKAQRVPNIADCVWIPQ